MKRELHPLLTSELCPPGNTAQAAQLTCSPTASAAGPVTDLINARNQSILTEGSNSYDEFCHSLRKLHKEKTFVPPVCLT